MPREGTTRQTRVDYWKGIPFATTSLTFYENEIKTTLDIEERHIHKDMHTALVDMTLITSSKKGKALYEVEAKYQVGIVGETIRRYHRVALFEPHAKELVKCLYRLSLQSVLAKFLTRQNMNWPCVRTPCLTEKKAILGEFAVEGVDNAAPWHYIHPIGNET